MDCLGCGAPATRYNRVNESLMLCTSCSKVLPWLCPTPIADLARPKCIGCGVSLGGAKEVCVFCRLDVLHFLDMHNVLDNNPIAYRFCESVMKPGATTYEWWKVFHGFQTADFTGLKK